jgi:hypothetical protein
LKIEKFVKKIQIKKNINEAKYRKKKTGRRPKKPAKNKKKRKTITGNF